MTIQIAIIYGSSEGQTRKIADHLARTFQQRGVETSIFDGEGLPKDFDVSDFDGAIIGASIHAGKYPRYISRLIRSHRDTLQKMPSAFFSVSLAEAADEEESKQDLQDSIHQFLGESDWQPLVIGSFAGALAFSKYGFLKKMLMKSIAKRQLGDVDTSRDYEYTDWASVDEFAVQFQAHLAAAQAASSEPRRARPGPR